MSTPTTQSFSKSASPSQNNSAIDQKATEQVQVNSANPVGQLHLSLHGSGLVQDQSRTPQANAPNLKQEVKTILVPSIKSDTANQTQIVQKTSPSIPQVLKSHTIKANTFQVSTLKTGTLPKQEVLPTKSSAKEGVQATQVKQIKVQQKTSELKSPSKPNSGLELPKDQAPQKGLSRQETRPNTPTKATNSFNKESETSRLASLAKATQQKQVGQQVKQIQTQTQLQQQSAKTSQVTRQIVQNDQDQTAEVNSGASPTLGIAGELEHSTNTNIKTRTIVNPVTKTSLLARLGLRKTQTLKTTKVQVKLSSAAPLTAIDRFMRWLEYLLKVLERRIFSSAAPKSMAANQQAASIQDQKLAAKKARRLKRKRWGRLFGNKRSIRNG